MEPAHARYSYATYTAQAVSLPKNNVIKFKRCPKTNKPIYDTRVAQRYLSRFYIKLRINEDDGSRELASVLFCKFCDSPLQKDERISYVGGAHHVTCRMEKYYLPPDSSLGNDRQSINEQNRLEWYLNWLSRQPPRLNTLNGWVTKTPRRSN